MSIFNLVFVSACSVTFVHYDFTTRMREKLIKSQKPFKCFCKLSIFYLHPTVRDHIVIKWGPYNGWPTKVDTCCRSKTKTVSNVPRCIYIRNSRLFSWIMIIIGGDGVLMSVIFLLYRRYIVNKKYIWLYNAIN